MVDYDFKAVEKKWQERWEKEKAFEVKEDSKKKKYYVLEMYPYPSGSGLHIGHAFNYILGDILARFKTMSGFNVLHPMGYDSFGLPAENAAIKSNANPKEYTENAIANFIRQQKTLGLSYDWSRKIQSHDPEYYRWNQFFFLHLFKRGLVYRKKSPANWCSKCNSVLANEQVHDGKCWIHKDTDVEIKPLEQWFLKTTAYADELLKEEEKLDWPERIKAMQRNWIGKSEGSEIMFEINTEEWPIFTTRADTLMGVTFMVISAQHHRLMEIVTSKQKKEVEAFLKRIKSTSEKDALALEKDGVFTGAYAVHPVSKEKIPVWTGNFVVADYGSGMVMAVPAHDQRDFEFAKKYKIPIKTVVQPDGKKAQKELKEAFTDPGVLVNSGAFNGLKSEEAKTEITKVLEEKELAKFTVNYKLRDWLVSRQRYWGTPIPMLHCEKCGVVPVSEKELPVLLPEDVKFGEGNPLTTSRSFMETVCPNCGGKARRETDTMDTFFDSSWYYLRFTDAQNKKEPFSAKNVSYWMPVDFYVGGAEHACMHLIYARFFTKALRDMGFLGFSEPFPRLYNQGMIHGEDGFVMSKSRGNVIDPLEISDKYGIDALRLFLVSVASPDKDFAWSNTGIQGCVRFISKVYQYSNEAKIGETGKRQKHKINLALKGINSDIEHIAYNMAVIKLRALLESLEKDISKEDFEKMVCMLVPFAPHIAEELWEKLGNKGFVSLSSWPKVDEKAINEEFEKADKALDNVKADIINIKNLLNKESPKTFLYVIPKELGYYKGNESFLANATGSVSVDVYTVNDEKKHDPQNKSAKAKPGKPGIYLE